jgi:hypothetical protein
MKKLAVLVVVFACFLVVGCRSNPYSIETNEIKDINGTIYTSSITLYADYTALFYQDKLTISQVKQNNVEFYRFEVELYKSDWIFVDTLKLKINNGDVITLNDDKPLRKVIPGTVGTKYSMGTPTRVYELAYFVIDSDTINKLKNCDTFVFQHKLEPVTLPPEAVNAIKDFLKSFSIPKNGN